MMCNHRLRVTSNALMTHLTEPHDRPELSSMSVRSISKASKVAVIVCLPGGQNGILVVPNGLKLVPSCGISVYSFLNTVPMPDYYNLIQ